MHSEPQAQAHIATAPGSLRAVVLPAVALCTIWVFAWYWETTFSIVTIWQRSETFTHGFVILPIVLYLVWRKRDELARIATQPFYPALLGIVVAGAMWLLGELASVRVLSQFGLVAMVPFSVWV